MITAGLSVAIVDALTATVTVIDFDTVNQDVECAMANAEADSEMRSQPLLDPRERLPLHPYRL